LEKQNLNNSCLICGKCCTYEIPLTIKDINNISIALTLNPKIIMSKYLKANLSSTTDLYLLRKNDFSKCVFIEKNNYCKINELKPEICKEFLCLKILLKNPEKIKNEEYVLPDKKMSGILTIEYIRRNGFQYNKSDFCATLKKIDNY